MSTTGFPSLLGKLYYHLFKQLAVIGKQPVPILLSEDMVGDGVYKQLL